MLLYVFLVMVSPIVALVEEFSQLSAVNRTYDHADAERAEQLSIALVADMRDEVRTLFNRWPHNPIMMSYSADATSFLVRAQADDRGVACTKTHRRGRRLQEFF